MIDVDEVVTTVRSKLLALPDLDLSTQLAWENNAFDPPDEESLYVEEKFIPFGERNAGSGYDRLTGEVRFTVVMPRGKGTEEGRALATQIKSLYPIDSSIVGVVTVVVEGSEVLSGRDHGDTRYAIPVSVSVRAGALRT